ncbi:hypothetical protein HF086_004818 [Spodoptera exigua]|uniref:Peptidase S1 domain-containing protein n=1 Tax=Spodoptera exigua TaxID=7107 RepID=A0A922M5H7_SPOEX|nr:hypothetical protein HF086_004818 [Spodoptera exigua]
MSRRNRLRTSFGNEVHQGAWPHHVLIFRLYNKFKFQYRAFCAGSIIGEKRVLTSTNCFFTNRKKNCRLFVCISQKKRSQLAGALRAILAKHTFHNKATNICYFLQVLTKPWVFNTYVNKIPYATKEQDFDGVCTATAVKATRSWSTIKYLYTQEVEMVPREECEKILCRSCRLFMCTVFNNRNQYAYSETEGGGLVCYETGDPAEVDINQGVLVAVTSIVNIGLPNLNMRVGLFSQWVTDVSCDVYVNKFVMVLCILLLCY